MFSQFEPIKNRRAKRRKATGNFEERHFERVITLPSGADPDKVEAKYQNGVLEVHLGKSPEAQRKRISVQG